VCLDHANLAAMTASLQHHMQLTADDRALLVLPLFHVNAIMLSIVAPLTAGGSAVILPRFDPRTFRSAVETERPTYFSAVPAVYVFSTPCRPTSGPTSPRSGSSSAALPHAFFAALLAVPTAACLQILVRELWLLTAADPASDAASAP
jgi:acyl-CoA synthetase (AMP-forming)/AMP-acid ligase II